MHPDGPAGVRDAGQTIAFHETFRCIRIGLEADGAAVGQHIGLGVNHWIIGEYTIHDPPPPEVHYGVTPITSLPSRFRCPRIGAAGYVAK